MKTCRRSSLALILGLPLLLALLWIGASPVAADSLWLSTDPLATKDPAAAPKADHVTFRQDHGVVAVLEVEGNYDLRIDGVLNSELRAAVGQEFLAHHPDIYDFLVVFTSFEVDLGPQVLGNHLGLRNSVAGIGLPLFDNSSLFGSNSRLQGYIDMRSVTQNPTQPLAAEFESTLTVLSHELMHQWCCYVDFELANGSISDSLRAANGHWSYLLASDASVMYGGEWQDQGDGTFSNLRRQRAYGPLDRYLAGWLSTEEVPAALLIDNPAIDPATPPPAPGTLLSGIASAIEIAAVVAAEGPRLPATDQAQRDFRIAFLLLLRPGEAVANRDLAGLERVAAEIATRFTVLSGGQALADSGPLADSEGTIGTPGGTFGGDPRPAQDLDLAAALTWLRGRQQPAGYWQDTAGTRVRDTVIALRTLNALDPTFTGAPQALVWLAQQEQPSTDSVARLAAALSLAGQDVSNLREQLAGRQNAGGGWGIEANAASDPLDTALALVVLGGALAEDPAVGFLEASQRTDGGWGHVAAGPSRTTTTTTVLRALQAADRQGAALDAALSFLGGRQNGNDGGFGDSPSTVHDTAQVISTLSRLEALEHIDSAAAKDFLAGRQTDDGSWDGSVYATALAVDSLRRFEVPDWNFAQGLSAQPASPRDGQRVQLEVSVRNASSAAAPAATLRFYNHPPEQGGIVIGDEVPIPALLLGQSATLGTTWDTFDQAGPRRLVAVIDPDNLVAEADELNNRSQLDLTVEPPPAGIDLEIDASEVIAMPAHPTRLPTAVEIAAVVRNFGSSDAANVVLRLFLGEPEFGQLLDQIVLPQVAARNSSSGLLTFQLSDPGSFELWVEAAPEGDVEPSNNRALVRVETAPALDLEILASDLQVSADPAVLGSDVTFTVLAHNRGTVDSVSFALALSVSDGTEVRQLPTLSTQLAAGQTVELEIHWRVDLTGALTFTAAADPDGLLPENDRDNNQASLAFTASALTEPNLSVASLDLSFDPEPALAGAPLQLSILLRNTGGTALSNVAVAFWDGHPQQGGSRITETTVAALAAGDQALVSASWMVSGDQDRLIYATADPDDAVAEIDESDNLAFRPLSVLGLPDLVLSDAALSLTPPFPTPGETALLSARISNLGERPAGPFAVRALRLDAAGNEVLIGEQSLSIAAFDEDSVSFSLTLPADDQPGLLRIIADVLDEVVEGHEDNNQASLAFAVQGSDFFVSERYFSPDGDGLQDSTRLFFRLPAAADVDLVVRNLEGAAIRRFEHVLANGASSGETLWDGRDDQGRLAIDGDYRLTIESHPEGETLGEVLGTALVSLDTNHSSSRLALGSEFARFTRFTCELYEAQRFELSDDERWLYFQALDDTFQPGLYRARPSGPGVPQEVLRGRLTDFAVSANASRLAFSPDLAFGDFEDVFLAAGDGSSASLARPASRVLAFDYLDRLLLLHRAGNDHLEALPRGGGLPIELASWPATEDWRYALSRDRQSLAILLDGSEMRLFDLLSGTTATLTIPGASDPFTLPRDGGDHAVMRWSPDGSLLAIADEDGEQLHLLDQGGTLLHSVPLAAADYPAALQDLDEFSPQDYANANLRAVRPIEWNSRGDQLAVLLIFSGNGIDFFAVMTVDASTGSAAAAAWSAAVETAPVMSPVILGKALGEPSELLPFESGQIPSRIEWWHPDEQLLLYGPQGIELRPGLPLDRVFEDFDDFSPLAFLPSGRGLIFSTVDGIDDPGCFGDDVPDLWSFFSLLNLWVELTVEASEQLGTFQLSGTAADLHLANWRLEWRRTTELEEVWRPIAAPSSTAVVDQPLAQWIAPGPGLYEVRLLVTDLAGNQRQVRRMVANADTPSIANVRLEPAVFSTTGGSTLANHTEVIYDVLLPVNLRFDIFDVSGTFVTTLLRDHPTAGSGFRQLWNGTDSLGRPVPDGGYIIRVAGLELAVEIDSATPRIEHGATLRTERRIEGSCGDLLPIQDLQPLRLFDFFEPNLDTTSFEHGAGATPAIWQPVGSDLIDCFASQTSDLRCQISVPSLTAATSYRATATDLAGNRSVVVSPPRVQTALLIERIDPPAAGRDRRLGGRLQPFFPPSLPGDLLLHQAQLLRLLVAESTAAALNSISIQYRPINAAAPWLSQTVASSAPLDGRFEVIWDATLALRGVELEVRLRGLASDGSELLSNSFPLLLDPVESRGRLRPADLEPTAPHGELLSTLLTEAALDLDHQSVLWAVVKSDDPTLRLSASISSLDDPAFASSQALAVAISAQGIYLLVPRQPLDDDSTYLLSFRLSRPLSCPDGGLPFSLDSSLGSALSVEIDSRFEATDCDPADASLEISMVPRGGALVSLRLEQRLGDELSTVFSIQQPEDGETYRFTPSLSLPLEQAVTFIAAVQDGSGIPAYAQLELPGQPALPLLDLTQPGASQRLCGGAEIPLAGSIDSELLFAYRLQLSRDGESFSTFHEVTQATSLDSLLAIYGDADEEPSLAAGPASWRLQVVDIGGNVVCAEVATEIVELQAMPLIALDNPLISPNGDGLLDQLTVTYDSADPATLSLAIRDPAGNLVRQLASSVAIQGSGALSWDGHDASNQLVADGVYTVAANFGGLCGDLQSLLLAVEVDTTAPEVAIAFPRPGDPLDTLIEIFGSAIDRNFSQFTVERSATGSAVWSLIDSATTPRQDGLLAVWNSFGLQGAHSLRLSASDRAGNRASTQVDLFFDQRLELISDLSAVPRLLSPNGDGQLDASSIVFGLSAAARIDLQIVNSDGAVQLDLLSAVERGAGTHPARWTGELAGGILADDGDYRLRLTAAPLDQPLALQVEDLVLSVDASPPTLALSQPGAGSVVRGTAAITGSVTDPHLLAYRVELASGDAGPWSVLATGSVERLDYDFAHLANVTEGGYFLRLAAEDSAANGSSLPVAFTVDNTPPEVSWQLPENGAVLSGVNGPQNLLGSLVELNLVQYRIEFGAGSNPASWLPIAFGTEVSGSTVSTPWDIAAVADGPYILRLLAEDGAGWISEARRSIEIDNSPPMVALTAPGDGDFITEPTAILGTATDAHLLDYRLAVAAAGSQAFTEVFVGQQAVMTGLLANWAALPPDGPHTLRLSATDLAGQQASVEIEVEIDLTPPPPVVLSGELQQSRDAHLSWTSSAAADLAGYEIQRDGVEISGSPTQTTQLVDAALTTGSYFYTVRAIDHAGLRSPASNEVELTVDIDPPLAVLLRPADGQRVRGLVEVLGSAHSALDFAEYRLSIAEGDLSTGEGSWQLLRRSPVPVLAGDLGQWQAPTLSDATYTLRLEAEDLVGNVADVRLLLTVDNAPPATPTGLAANANGDDVTTSWDANIEPDLAGYLLYRDGQPLGDGSDTGDFGNLLIEPSGNPLELYLDTDVADAEHIYTVVAIDLAGNLSPPSAPAHVVVETGPPRAILVSPEDGREFDQTLFLAAIAEDGDIAQVQFQQRATGAAIWTDLSIDLTPPWEATWDPGILPFGGYQLRALATDFGARGDANPPSLSVTYRDLTAPAAVDGLTLVAVDGGQVELSWNANTSDPDLAGYRVFRAVSSESPTALNSNPISATTYTDNGLADSRYDYTVRAVDDQGNVSLASNSVDALIYTPTLDPLLSPTPESSLDATGTTPVAGASIEAVLVGPAGSQTLAAVLADAAGVFVLPAVSLQAGDQTLTVRSRSGVVLSKPASQGVISAPPPAAPSGLAAVVTGQQVELSWNANSEPDLLGYHLLRDDLRLTEPALTNPDYNESLADGTYGYRVQAVNIHGFESPLSALLEVEVGDGLAPEPVVLSGQAEGSDVVLTWSASASGDVARYRVFRDGLEIGSHADLGDLSYRDQQLANATYVYQVAAVDVGSNVSELSNQVAVTVAIAPLAAPEILAVSPLAEGGVLAVTWQAAPASNPATFELRRATLSGGPYATLQQTPLTSHQDLDLTSGLEYFYIVVAFDSLGNPSPPSAEASGIPGALGPLAPPVFSEPGSAAQPHLTDQLVITVGGRTESGAVVTVLHDGTEIGQASTTEQSQAVPGPGAELSFNPSADGRWAIVYNPFGVGLYDFNSDSETAILGLDPPLSFFADSSAAVFANRGAISRYSLSDGSVELLATIDSASFAVPSPDGQRLAVIGTQQGLTGLWIYDLDSANWTLLIEGFGFDLPQWSPDGVWLAYPRFSQVNIIQVASAAAQVVDPGFSSSLPSWSPDSQTLAYSLSGNQDEDLWLFHLATGSREPLLEGPRDQIEPRFSADGSAVGYIDTDRETEIDGSLFRLDLASGNSEELFHIGPDADGYFNFSITRFWSWTPADALFVDADLTLYRIASGSRFTLLGVEVEPGDNLFTAVAADDLGRISQPAEPMLVTVVIADRPDLEITASDLHLVPAVGRIGEPLRLSVTVHNRGDQAAAPSELALLQLGEDGSSDPLGSPLTVAAIAAGASSTVLVDLGPFAAAGSFEIRAEVDPQGLLPEISEANNQASTNFQVLAGSAPRLTVTTDRATYGAATEVAIRSSVIQGGEPWSGELLVSIEDRQGFLVQALGSTAIEELEIGVELLLDNQWNSANTFAGTYQVHGQLIDSSGQLVAEDLAEFELDEDLELATEVITDQPHYTLGETVQLTGGLTYLNGNAALTGATATLLIKSPAGAVLQQWTEPLGVLLPGASSQLVRNWPSSGNPGLHTARFEIHRAETLLSASETTFELLAEEPLFAELNATKTVELTFDGDGDGFADPGDRLRYRITLSNSGTGPATAVLLEDPIPAHTELVAGSVSGAGTLLSSDPLRVDFGQIAAGASGEINFEVTVDNPLPGGVEEIVNQGTVSADGLESLPTDDPTTPEPLDATRLPVRAAAELVVSKIDILQLDADGNGAASAGDTLRWEIHIENHGNANADQVVLRDFAPQHTSIVVGSATTTGGQIDSEDPLRVSLGALPAGGSATVSFAAMIDSQLTDEVREVLNQATVSSTSLPVVLSDDPDLGGDADPTLTPLEHAPRLVAEKTVSLDAADSDGRAGPGDLLHYTLVLRNLGAGAATGLLLSDPIPAHTNVVPGSVLSSLGTVLNEQPLEVAINELAAGTVATVSFSVRIDQPLARGVEEIVNQSTLTADDQPILLSDDPTLAGSADPTVIAVLTGTPRLLPRKTALLFDDRDGDGLLSPGDGLLYLIEVGNRGDGLATGLRLEDSLPPGTSLEAGSVQTSQGTVLSEQPLIIDLGQLGSGAEATVTLVLRIAEPFPADQLAVVNQARITSAELPLLLTDDPTTSAVDDATVREVFITPTVSLSDSSVSENSGPASFDLLLSTPPNRPLSVAWQTADGTASAGNDYLATNGSSELAAGETAAVVEIEIVDDQLNEHDETFLLQLTAATGAVIGDGAGQATITDQDPPPAITLGDASTLEGDAGATPVGLKLLLSNASGLDIAVDYTTVDGSAIGGEDYRRKSSSLAIAAGETSATLEVEVLGDLKDELDESFAVLVTSASGATVADPSGTIEVIDDDQTRLSVLDRTVTEGDEGSREAAFEVRLSHESDRPVSVDYQTREDTARTGEDFLATQDTLLLEAGRMRAEIAVPVLGDEIFEPLEETFHLDLTHPIGAELATASALGTILDDELCAGPELLRNPGAELPLLGSDLPNEQAQLAVWVQVAGEHWYRREQDPLAAEGAAYFAAGQAETAELSQVVDLSGYSEVIARGELLLAFSGHLRTAEEQPSDTARVVVEYFEEDGNLLLDSFDSGEIVSPSEWLRVEDLRLVPVGTDRVRVRLLSNRLEGDTSDGYFDALSLRVIRQPVVEIDDLRIAEGHSASAVGELSVRLSCAIDRPLSITWETVDGTATSGVDYIEARGALELASGTVGGVIEVEILGDTEHELHEDFFVELREIEPAGLAIAPQPRGRVSILNDDFCARSPGYWQHHSDLWPLSELALGDQQIDQSGTLALLQYGGSDAASKLARQLITTELNLAVGSDPLDILATVEAAHAFLADWPPGSRPRGPDRAEANRLKDILDAYNNPGCTPVAVLP